MEVLFNFNFEDFWIQNHVFSMRSVPCVTDITRKQITHQPSRRFGLVCVSLCSSERDLQPKVEAIIGGCCELKMATFKRLAILSHELEMAINAVVEPHSLSNHIPKDPNCSSTVRSKFTSLQDSFVEYAICVFVCVCLIGLLRWCPKIACSLWAGHFSSGHPLLFVFRFGLVWISHGADWTGTCSSKWITIRHRHPVIEPGTRGLEGRSRSSGDCYLPLEWEGALSPWS